VNPDGHSRNRRENKVKKARMKKLYPAILHLLIIALCFTVPVSAEQSSANYSIDTDVLSGGGGECSSTGYYLLHTTGQPTAIGMSSSASYTNYAGFWYTLTQPQAGCYWLGDINCDDAIDISDVILVLRIALQLDSGKPCSDINGDSGVDISDVILTLRMALALDPKVPC
jgi:hypothetical protein